MRARCGTSEIGVFNSTPSARNEPAVLPKVSNVSLHSKQNDRAVACRFAAKIACEIEVLKRFSEVSRVQCLGPAYDLAQRSGSSFWTARGGVIQVQQAARILCGPIRIRHYLATNYTGPT
jgi:hypothetical protein